MRNEPANATPNRIPNSDGFIYNTTNNYMVMPKNQTSGTFCGSKNVPDISQVNS